MSTRVEDAGTRRARRASWAATLCATLLLVGPSACGGGRTPPLADVATDSGADGVSQDARTDAAQPGPDVPSREDTGPDARPRDVPPGPDAATDVAVPDAPAAPDGGADAGPDAARPAGCDDLEPLPAWAFVEDDDDGGPPRLVARLADRALHVQPLADAVLRVTYTPADGTPPARSAAVLERRAPATPAVFGGRDGAAAACGPGWMATTDADGHLRIADDVGRALLEDAPAGYARTAAGATLARRAPAGTAYYGFGEKTGPLQKRGQRMVFWNTDPYDPAWGGYGPGQDPLYQSIPFYVALADDGVAHGVFTDDPRRLVIDVAAAAAGEVRLETPAALVDQYVVLGPGVEDVARRYVQLTGRPPLPPRWALGLHQSRWGYTADEARAVARRYRAEAIPLDALWLDIQHMDGFRTFTWDPAQYPDPTAFVAELTALDVRTIVIADPCLKADPAWDVWRAAEAGDHLLRRPDGSMYLGTAWPGTCGFPDVTAARTRAWWADHVGWPLSHGVAGIWLDVNEPTTFEQPSVSNDVPVDGDGDPAIATMAEAHNLYALHEARATWDGFRAAAPTRRPFVLSRAGYAGIQRYAAVWTGDVPSTWHGLAESLPMMLNLSLSGVALVGSDVGGYAGGATPELYARWLALGAHSPFFRVHTTRDAPRQEPWEFGTEVRDIARDLAEWRSSLAPYLYSALAAAHETGAPVLRPLVLAAPADPVVRELGDQALLGRDLLVAPVLAEGATTRSIYLPAGRWFEFWSGAVRDGGARFETGVTRAALPVWVRAGAVIPRQDPAPSHAGVPAGPLYLDVYPAADATTTSVLYEDEGDGFAFAEAARYARTVFTLRGRADGATLTATREGAWTPPARPVVVRVRRVDAAPAGVTKDGAALPARASYDDLRTGGEGWWWDEDDRAAVLAFPDPGPGGFALALEYDPTVTDPRPPVRVPLVVQLPAGTPRDTAIHVATSADGWATHQPLAWGPGPDEAHGTVLVPRGEWFEYKYTRGGWETVEKWPACEEATNRYSFGAAHPSKHDTVYGWRDWCP